MGRRTDSGRRERMGRGDEERVGTNDKIEKINNNTANQEQTGGKRTEIKMFQIRQ